MKSKSCFIITFILVLSKAAISQPCLPAGRVAGWVANDPFEQKVFVENKGQFNGSSDREFKLSNWEADPENKIRYVVANEGVLIYFTPLGLTYRKDEFLAVDKGCGSPAGDKKSEVEKETTCVTHYVHMNWLEANPDVQIIAQDVVGHYFTYGNSKIISGKSDTKASAFKKITYKNLYPNIDVEYVFPEQEKGIKYNLILHPGADASLIKMKYDQSTYSPFQKQIPGLFQNKIYMDKQGNIQISTPAGNFVDHSPRTYSQASNHFTIPSAFNLINNIVSFSLAQYDHSQTIIIDPWTTNPVFTGYNAAYDVEFDFKGNVYVYGGQGGTVNPFQVIKLNSAGVIQWIYTTTPFSSVSQHYGDFTVDGSSGSCYMVQGLSLTGGAMAIKINTLGNQVAVYPGNGLFKEMWRVEYNNCTKRLIVAGGGTSSANNACIFDTTLSSMTLVNVLSAVASGYDMCLLALDNSNAYYMASVQTLTCCNPAWTALDNVIISGPAGTLLPRNYLVKDNYSFVECSSIGYYNGALSSTSNAGSGGNGMNGMAVSSRYLYTYDGRLLQRWNKNTGTLLNSAVISSTPFLWGGIDVDDCENIYVGMRESVIRYDTNFTFISKISTQSTVYDLQLGPGNKLYVCGKQFVSSFQLIDVVCHTFDLSTVAIPSGCTTSSGTASVTPIGGNPPYTYLWSNGQTAQTAIGLYPGIYTITVFDSSSRCDGGGYTSSDTVTIKSSNGFVASVSQTGVSCSGGNNGQATITATGGNAPYTYSWSSGGQTNFSASGLSAGTYSITVTDFNGCKTVLVTNISEPLPTIYNLSVTNITCNGNGGAQVSIVSGTSPYSYSWSMGSTLSGVGALAPGGYTVTITDGNACSQIKNFTIASTSSASATFIFSSACVGTQANFTNTGTPPGTGVTYSWVVSPITPANVSGTTTNFSYTFLTAGTYSVSHTVTNAGCTNTVTQNIAISNCSNGPVITATGSSVCPGTCGTVTSAGTGGASPYTYSWSNGATTQNINPCPVATTVYTVTIKDSGGNTSTSTAVVAVNPGVAFTATATNITCNGGSNGSVATTVSGGSPAFTYSWSTGLSGSGSQVSGLGTGTYTVTLTDSKGCTAISTATIASPPLLLGLFTKGTASCTGCGCKEWLMVNAAGGTSPYSFTWPDGYINRYKNQLCPGNYNVNIKDKNGCSINVNLTAP